MSDEIKTDAEKALGDVKAEIGKLETAEHSASGWVKTHIAWIIGLGCMLVGVVVGYHLHR